MKIKPFLILLLPVLLTCKHFDPVVSVRTLPASQITGYSAELTGTVTDPGNGIRECGHIFWPSGTEGMAGKEFAVLSADTFRTQLVYLKPATTYLMKAFANDGSGDVQGDVISFTTLGRLPNLITTAVTSITSSSAWSGGTVVDSGDLVIFERGVCWSTHANPTLEDDGVYSISQTVHFACEITGLSASTTYYVRAFAINAVGLAYGDPVSFTTGPSPDWPSVATDSVFFLTTVSAHCAGSVSADGGSAVTSRGICWKMGTNPTVYDFKTVNGTGTGSFTGILSGLIPGQTYYARAYAVNAAGTAYGNEIQFQTRNTDLCPESVTDYDSNEYSTIQIGNQCWMKQNLKTTHYADGEALTGGSKTTFPPAAFVPERYWMVYADSLIHKDTYGLLYNWSAITRGVILSELDPGAVQGVCPSGWHVPDRTEWIDLLYYLGGYNGTGGKLKEAGTEHWRSPNAGATDESGFTALPGGAFHEFLLGWSAVFGTSDLDSNHPIFLILNYHHDTVSLITSEVDYGCSVRCVRD